MLDTRCLPDSTRVKLPFSLIAAAAASTTDLAKPAAAFLAVAYTTTCAFASPGY